MRGTLSKPIGAMLVLLTLLGCTVFTVGPFSLRYDLTATTEPGATADPQPTAEIVPTAAVDPDAADLELTELVAVGTGVNPRCGENTTVSFTVQNTGNSASAANILYVADVYRRVTTTSAFYGIPPLQPGERYRGSVNIVVGPPANFEHALQAQVDSEFTVPETDEQNNWATITYNVDDGGNCTVAVSPTVTPDSTPRPNLVVEALSFAGGTPRCGENLRVDFTVRNAGTEPSPAHTLGLRDAANGTIVTEASYGFGPLQVGESASSSLNITIPGPPNTLHTLTAVADDSAVIGEMNETDNIRSITFTLEDSDQCGTPTDGLADLIVSAINITGSGVNPRCGEASRVDFTVTNIGTGTAGPSTLLAIDYVASTFDIAGYAEASVPALAPGANYSGSVSLTIMNSPNVPHRLNVSADGLHVVEEVDDANNGALTDYNVDDIGLCN